MRFNLRTFTDVAEFLILDPTMIEGIGDLPSGKWPETIDQLTTSGKALAYSYSSDGEALFGVFIGEEPPADWLKNRMHGVEGARLCVPGGRLVATGGSILTGDNIEKKSIVEIPPGDYLVDAFDVNQDSEELDARLDDTVGHGRVKLYDLQMKLVGFGVICTVFGIFAAIASPLSGGGLTGLKVAAIIVGAYWLLISPVLIAVRIFKTDDVYQAIESMQCDNPETIIWLRPIGDETKFSQGKFGSGYIEEPSVDTRPTLVKFLGCFSSGLLLLLFCFIVALVIALVTYWVTN